MLGPNGERLVFNITDGSSLSSCEKPNRISIQSRAGRSDSASYSADVSCPTIVHETGHTMGLKDEYIETIKGTNVNITTGNIHEGTTPSVREFFLPDYNCRVIQFNSLMGSHGERFESVKKGYEHSLLDPTHFNVILYGSDCSSRDDIRLYQQCTSLAYDTNYRENSLEDDCLPEKQQCEASNVLGRDLEKSIANLEVQLKKNLDQISFMNNKRFPGFLGNESLSHILRGTEAKLRDNPGILRKDLFTSQELDDIKSTLSPALYKSFDMFLDDRDYRLRKIIVLRKRLRHFRSLQ